MKSIYRLIVATALSALPLPAHAFFDCSPINSVPDHRICAQANDREFRDQIEDLQTRVSVLERWIKALEGQVGDPAQAITRLQGELAGTVKFGEPLNVKTYGNQWCLTFTTGGALFTGDCPIPGQMTLTRQR
jgi:hypothetical protein